MQRSPIAYGNRRGVEERPEGGLYLAAFPDDPPPSEDTSGEVIDLHVDQQEAEEFRRKVSRQRRLRVRLRRAGAGEVFVECWLVPVSSLTLKEQELVSKVRELEDTRRAMLNLLEEMEATKRELERLSITDELTGLFNRRHFYKILAREMEVARKYGMPLSLLIMDLDDFKDYNDTHGHVEGDRALRRLAGVIERSIRSGLDSAYRLGGDEFAVIAPGSNREQARKMGERIQDSLKDLSLSIGIAEFVKGMDADSFISQADKRMYEEKRRRKKEAPSH